MCVGSLPLSAAGWEGQSLNRRPMPTAPQRKRFPPSFRPSVIKLSGPLFSLCPTLSCILWARESRDVVTESSFKNRRARHRPSAVLRVLTWGWLSVGRGGRRVMRTVLRVVWRVGRKDLGVWRGAEDLLSGKNSMRGGWQQTWTLRGFFHHSSHKNGGKCSVWKVSSDWFLLTS